MSASPAAPISLKKGSEPSDPQPVTAPAASKGVDSLGLLMLRNAFYNVYSEKMLYVVLSQLLIILALVFIMVKMIDFTSSRDYFFPVNADNTLILERPLADPLFSNQEISDWAVKAVTQTMTFGYYDHLMRLQSSRGYFTLKGWEQFTKAIDDAGILATIGAAQSATIRGVKQVISTQLRPGEMARIKDQGVWYGAYYWVIEMQIDVSFQRQGIQTRVPWKVEVNIIRLPANQSREGVGIQSLLAKRG